MAWRTSEECKLFQIHSHTEPKPSYPAVSYTDNAMLQNDSRVWVRGSFLISQWHDPGKSSHGSLQHRNSLCTVARSFLPGSHTVHHTVKQLQEKAAGDTVLALDAQQYMQLIDKPTTWCVLSRLARSSSNQQEQHQSSMKEHSLCWIDLAFQ